MKSRLENTLRENPTIRITKATVTEYLLGDSKISVMWLIVAMLLYIMWIVTSVTKDVWILQWATASLDPLVSEPAVVDGVVWYGCLLLASIVLAVAAAMCVFAFSAISVNLLFKRTTHALFRASMTFFYETQTGEILDRFQQDLETADKFLPSHLSLFLLSSAAFLGRAAVFGWILGPLAVLIAVLGYWLQVRAISFHFYQELTRSVLRAHADRLSFLSEALDGEAVLRAFGNDRVARLMEDLERINERLCRVQYMSDVFNCHTIQKAEAATAVLAFSLLGVLAVHPVRLAELLLVLFYLLTMYEDLVPRFGAGIANTWEGLYTVERLRQFRGMPAEADIMPSPFGTTLLNSWPRHGQITFETVSFAYADPSTDKAISTAYGESTVALRDVSLSLRGGEKVGVIGRTGSGKSSLAMALLRVHPLRSGRILLDGVDLRTVPLSQLRRSFTMIPQSPTFYRCSIRDYLDPFREFDDARLWKELLTVELGQRVQSLEEELLDNGENWSLGQRQLLCFARALLRPSRVVVLDEAFSCVDQSCQEKILRILRERFAKSTVVLVTHRLDQILAFDRIVVMKGGRVVENGSAAELASDAGSVFYEFLETSLLTL